MNRFALIILLVLSIPWSRAFAQEIERDPDFVAGRAALEDGFYDVAAQKLEKFVNETIVKRKKANASIFLFRAWYGMGENQKIIDWLKVNWDLSLGTRYESGYQFWHAQAKYAMGSYDRTLELLKNFETKYPNDEFLPYVIRLRALALRDDHQLEASLAQFSRYSADYQQREEYPDNLLDWAGVLVQLNRDDEAREKLLELATKFDDKPAAKHARLWLGLFALEHKQLDEAASWLTPLAQDTKADSTMRADAWFALARSAVDSGQVTNALAALAQGEQLTTNVERRVEARIDQARLLMGLDRLDEAVQIMDATVFTLASQPQAARAQLELSDLLRAQKQYEKAAEAYQRYLESFSDAAGQRHALYSKAWCLWELHRYGEAALAFEKAYIALHNMSLREQALIKAADSYLMNGQNKLAAITYEKALAEFPQSPELPTIMYQAAESYARSADPTNAIAYFNRTIETFPTNEIAQISMMRLARFYEEQKDWNTAVTTFDQFLTRYPGSERFPQALLERAMLRYRFGAYEDSLADFERLMTEYPKTPWAERAYFMRGWCYYQLGEVKKAVQIGNQFLSDFKNSEWTVEVSFWLAEHEFNTLNYGVAETNFVAISSANPSNVLADKSIYWAGRSAVEQKAYRRAIDYFTLLTRMYTNSVLVPDARFAQGDALTEIGDFAGAILAYNEILKSYPGSPLAVRALGRIGDCQFTLGADRVERYQEAIASFRAVLTHPQVTQDLAIQAEYKLARAYERLGRTDDALTHYLNVVYGWLASRDEGIPVDEVWFVRSAFSAATLKEAAYDWDAAIAIYQRVIDSGITAGADAMIRIDRISNQRQKAGSTSSPQGRTMP